MEQTTTKKKAVKLGTELVRQLTDDNVKELDFKEASIIAGYATTKKAETATKSKEFQDWLEDAGLTDQALAFMLAEDLQAKKGNRIQELKLLTTLKGLDKKVIQHEGVEEIRQGMDLIGAIIDGEYEEIIDDDDPNIDTTKNNISI